MNAVNLIPADARRGRGSGRPSLSFSAPFVGLVGGLVVVLVALVLYMTEHEKVNSRRADLAKVNAGVASWSAAASRYSADVQKLNERVTRAAAVGGLAAQRFDWTLLLGQLAGRMPAQAQLTSMQATPPSAAGAASTGAPDTTGAPSAGVALTACAASQNVVAESMVALRHVAGISRVILASSTKGGAAAGSASSTGTNSCHFPIQFVVTLQFGAAAHGSSANTSGATGVTQ